MNLTKTQKIQYTNSAPAKSGVGIGLPVSNGVNNTPKTICVFFIAKNSVISTPVNGVSMMGCVGVSQDTLFPFDSKTNPAQLITSFDWSLIGDENSHYQTEQSIMTNISSTATPVANPTVFNFQSNYAVRIIKNAHGEPLFCLKDVCNILAIQNHKEIVKNQLNSDGVEKIYLTDKLGRLQQVTFINEPNLYRIIFRSNKAEARQFQDWVFNEVLPSIRKTGQYQVQPFTNTLTPQPQAEYLNHQDWNNLRRLVWLCESRFSLQKTAGFAIWARLREVTGVKSPEKFEVKHLPILAAEFQRILGAMLQYQESIRHVEQNIAKYVLRQGNDEMLPLLLKEFEQQSQLFHQNLHKQAERVFKQDYLALVNRA